MNRQTFRNNTKLITAFLLVFLIAGTYVFAQTNKTIHPTFPILDENGVTVLTSGKPISTMKTCGNCHDTQFIETHSFHSDLGLSNYTESGESMLRPWDLSNGAFGQWNSLLYRCLTPKNDPFMDLGTPGWIKMYGLRHAGGGPAVRSRDGKPLTSLTVKAGDPETHILDPETGQMKPWNWKKSGVVEMNCFLCHIPNPDNDARSAEIAKGNFKWANTATLNGTGIVSKTASGWKWNRSAFDARGDLKSQFVLMQDPTDKNCAACHGKVVDDPHSPLLLTECKPAYWNTETTGQIISPQRISDSGMNLQNKNELSRPWDVHAERLVRCVNCHYSINNPSYHEGVEPGHIKFEARRLDLKEYLIRPSHQFAKGKTVQHTIAPELANTMRRCESCHATEKTHQWLPYKDRHLAKLACESCHIPKIYSPTKSLYDWTVIDLKGEARIECRGIEGNKLDPTKLITGYEPVLLPRKEQDGRARLVPYNLITSYFWVSGEPERPVRLVDLKKAFIQNKKYHPDLVAVFDEDGDGTISAAELILNKQEKIDVVKKRLQAVGVMNPRIVSEVQPYGIHHDVIGGDWSTQTCESCHSEDSRMSQPFLLAAAAPIGVQPVFVNYPDLDTAGKITTNDDGAVLFVPETTMAGMYILGHDSNQIVKWIGILTFLGVLFGVAVHGGLRILAARKIKHDHSIKLEEKYLYEGYERFWHWLQALAIILLIFTGLIIHAPEVFSIFSFKGVVYVHNTLGILLALNAIFAVFYYLASGRVRMYLPEPKGFFNQAITQIVFYTSGIFKGEPHPFKKEGIEDKLNPMQKLTYLAILNVLLPLQIITGALIMGAQHFQGFAEKLGGLTFLIPIHTLIAWFFAAFVVLHIYLTTTGHTPFAAIKAMITGWEEVEVSENSK